MKMFRVWACALALSSVLSACGGGQGSYETRENGVALFPVDGPVIELPEESARCFHEVIEVIGEDDAWIAALRISDVERQKRMRWLGARARANPPDGAGTRNLDALPWAWAAEQYDIRISNDGQARRAYLRKLAMAENYEDSADVFWDIPYLGAVSVDTAGHRLIECRVPREDVQY